MSTTTQVIIASTKIRASDRGYTRGLKFRGLLVREAGTDETATWINNFCTHALDPQKGDLIRYDGKSILCIVEATNENEF